MPASRVDRSRTASDTSLRTFTPLSLSQSLGDRRTSASASAGRSNDSGTRLPARSVSLPASDLATTSDGETDAMPVDARDQAKDTRPAIYCDDVSVSKMTSCGIDHCRPKFLQKFSTRRWLLFWLCWYCTIQGMVVNGLLPSVLSTLERRFNFRASSLGRIMQAYDIAYALCCVPVSYFGDRHSKPLYLGLGLLLIGIGSFLFAAPHFFVGTHIYYSRQASDLGFCEASLLGLTTNATSGLRDVASKIKACIRAKEKVGLFQSVVAVFKKFQYEFLFGIAHLLHGIGATPLFTLGVSLIDENVKPSESSLYVGIFYTGVIIGPAAGFFMSAVFLSYHTNFLSLKRHTTLPEIDESDPEWVGAWWVGFLIASVLSVFAAFPILSFPRVLPDALKWQAGRLKAKERGRLTSKAAVLLEGKNECSIHVSKNGKKKYRLVQRLRNDVRQIPSAIWHLMTNRSYVCLTLAAAADSLLISGFSGFMSKYLERQFNMRSSRANMLIGSILVPFAGLGTLSSGYIVKRLKMNCKSTLKMCIFMSVSSLIMSPMFFVYCKPALLIGVQTSYPNTTEKITKIGEDSLEARCNSHCSCTMAHFYPVCGIADGEPSVYFSSCFAGCTEKFERAKRVYHNCSCSESGQVTTGWCESQCSALVVFLILFAPICYFTFSIGVPALSVVLRTVNFSERGFALGIQWIAIRCIGTIPAPLIFSWLFEVSCLIRRPSEKVCGLAAEGTCYVYDNKLLADLFLAFAILGQSVTLTFLVLALTFYRGNDEGGEFHLTPVRQNTIPDDVTSSDHPTTHSRDSLKSSVA